MPAIYLPARLVRVFFRLQKGKGDMMPNKKIINRCAEYLIHQLGTDTAINLIQEVSNDHIPDMSEPDIIEHLRQEILHTQGGANERSIQKARTTKWDNALMPYVSNDEVTV